MLYEEIVEKDKQFFMPVYGNRLPIAIERGNGCYLFDNTGKKYIDFVAGIATNAIGYGDPGFLDHMKEQMNKVCHFSNLYYNEPQALLVEKLCSYMDEPYKAFICNSGAEANECAIKLVRKHFKEQGKYKILGLRNSFHGRTIATLSETGQDKFHKDFVPLCPEFDFFSTIEELKEKIDDKTGAIIIELIQGEGGVNPLALSFVKNIEAVCKENDLLLIIDEIQTGIGRTGTMFAFQDYGLSPDIFTLAKALGGGLPIGACVAKAHISFAKGDHGTTFGGNALCCSAANYMLKVIDDDMLYYVNEMSKYFFEKLAPLHPRGKGLLIGFTIDKLNNYDIVKKCLEKGLLVLTAGFNTVRIVPPLIISKKEIDKGVEILFEAIKELEEA